MSLLLVWFGHDLLTLNNMLHQFLYVGGYQIGFGPIAWLLISEMFPLDVRGEGMALGVQANFFFNLVCSLSFSTELDLIGDTASFGIYGGIAIGAYYFVHW